MLGERGAGLAGGELEAESGLALRDGVVGAPDGCDHAQLLALVELELEVARSDVHDVGDLEAALEALTRDMSERQDGGRSRVFFTDPLLACRGHQGEFKHVRIRDRPAHRHSIVRTSLSSCSCRRCR